MSCCSVILFEFLANHGIMNILDTDVWRDYMYVAITGAGKARVIQVSNHHFKWWLDISPIRALLLAHLKGGYRKHYYHLPLKEAIS